tara:strand:- start:1422 stop:2099 length:678 start_codon:yes stop_codon:yes gene_type:complete
MVDINILVIISSVIIVTFLVAFFTRKYLMNWIKNIMSEKPKEKPKKEEPKINHKTDSTEKNFADELSKKINKKLSENEVFHIGDNIFTYDQAEAMCKSQGAELATYDQIVDAYKSGAEWCSYGWSKDKMALYPTQKTTYDALQKVPEEHRSDCGSPGINGGVFEDKSLRFGVNCYGKRPAAPKNTPNAQDYLTRHKESQKTLVNYFKDTKNKYSILPYNRNKWRK